MVYHSVATGSGHPDYPDHLDHFLSGSKWVLPGQTNMPDQDQKYLAGASLSEPHTGL